MRDRYFYPLALLLAAALVGLALLPAHGARPDGPVSVGTGSYERIEVAGMDLNRLDPGSGAERTLLTGDGPPRLRIAATGASLPDDPVIGPHFPIEADVEQAFGAHVVTVSVEARAAPDRPADRLELNYSTGRDGESGWQAFDLGAEWATYAFTYRVPPKVGANGLDYLAVRPSPAAGGAAVVIRSVVFERGERWSEVSQ